MIRGPITYKDAGVDIDKANKTVKSIRKLVGKNSVRPGVIGTIGGFSGFFDARFKKMKNPVLAASADGVGTKLMLANLVGRHDTVGIDLVAMCANDIIACGAEPLFFLDYFATGKLDSATMLDVMRGVSRGCRQAGCTLIGGETAELPGLYKSGDYDMAGFCIGVVDKTKIIDGSNIKAKDVVLGIASSGPHSNGYSLIRKVFSKAELKNKFNNTLLKPTIIYVKPVLALLKKMRINGMAHITGGGFYDNIIRILPKGRAAVLNAHSWNAPAIFKIVQERSRLGNEQMYRTFNMGIGMVLILRREDALKARRILRRFRFKSYIIGEIVNSKRKVVI